MRSQVIWRRLSRPTLNHSASMRLAHKLITLEHAGACDYLHHRLRHDHPHKKGSGFAGQIDRGSVPEGLGERAQRGRPCRAVPDDVQHVGAHVHQKL